MAFPSKAVSLALTVLVGLALCSSGFAKDDAARLAALKARVKAIAEETSYVESITKVQRLGRAFGYYTDKGFFGEAADQLSRTTGHSNGVSTACTRERPTSGNY